MKLQIAIDSAKFDILGFITDKYHKAMEQKKIQEKVNDIIDTECINDELSV